MSEPVRIEVAWLLKNSEPIVIGPEPRTVLQLHALHDAEIVTVHVLFLGMTEGGEAETVLVQQPRGRRRRKLRPEGEATVVGVQDLQGGLTAEPLDFNTCKHPHDFWQRCGAIRVPRGLSVGVVVRANQKGLCRATLGGR